MEMRWENDIMAEDLPEPYSRIVEWVGLENTLKLASELGGRYVYFPKKDVMVRAARDRAICREFTGYNLADLAKKYDLTDNRIREILAEGGMKPKSNPNQVTLLDIITGG
ncbi:Mor transcription activator domain protein [Desulforamulus ruminis DSM 2154]|uniref:Mor transcription activator domain protein n=2 Tax=Desulforamulus ruminis TaxID=1564 RepID=F6DTH0_DESRL|nr:Mor transcription activator domain protein [Desulforamulus ruminis DSM 2154]